VGAKGGGGVAPAVTAPFPLNLPLVRADAMLKRIHYVVQYFASSVYKLFSDLKANFDAN